jgi:DNA-binding XRE family transcriptional regulator
MRNSACLVWLPRPEGLPPLPLSPQARIAMGCLFRRLERGMCIRMPCTKEIRCRGAWLYESRIRDRRTEWRVLYRIEHDFIVIGEVLQARPTLEMPSFDSWRALVEYDGSPEHPQACKWARGDFVDFLELTDAEVGLVDIRLALARRLQHVRCDREWTQSDMAGELGTSQSRIARMEDPDPSVSIELLVKSLLALGASREELGAVIAGSPAA